MSKIKKVKSNKIIKNKKSKWSIVQFNNFLDKLCLSPDDGREDQNM
jgi:hypothetical protein